MDPYLLIEASAGTGKTQALAERLIALLREGRTVGLKPQEIVALTFSRAAAGEIFERFVSLLATRAETDPSHIALLREVIATQHLSQIGTLDSFLMRIVRSFPLELGLVGALEMMDDYQAAVERAKTSFAILRRTDAQTKRAFTDAFTLAMNRADVRSFVASYHQFITAWHEQVLALGDPSAWGEASRIWDTPPVDIAATERELAAAADAVVAASNEEKVKEFAVWVRGFRGGFDGVKGLAKKLLEKDDLFTGATIDVKLGRSLHTFSGAGAAAIRRAMGAVFGFVLRLKLELARGVYGLISAYEKVYHEKVRAKGRLVFADVPRLLCGLREADRLALDYRMDTRIRAWALDEFQDTSREQWRALRPLIEEAKQSGGEKSVFIVGDRKQAIYGWRNGDVGIFTRERETGPYAKGELSKTYRSGQPVVDAVNSVFCGGAIRDSFPAWTSPRHETARPELGGFVGWMDAPGPKMDCFIAPVLNAIKAVDPVARGLSAAILVRSNDFGERLATELKSQGLAPVVWEGESAIYDTPALSGFLDLVALADHPGDDQAYRHFVSTPLARAKYPDGAPSAAVVSAEAAAALTARGLVRVFRELRALLPTDPAEAWSVATEERFTDFLRAASEFELTMKPGAQLSDFTAYLKARKKRNLAEPGKIKIMTIHRSKGLGFDYVVLPLYEHAPLNAKAEGALVTADWILPNPGPRVARAVPGLMEAWRARQDRDEQEALCLYYVAMTRAKRAMTIITHPAPKSATESVRFSDLVRNSLPAEIGDWLWYRHLSAASAAEAVSPASPVSAVSRGPRVRIQRRLPSQHFQSGMSAGDLFQRDNGRAAARLRGTQTHARLERIAWIDPAAATAEEREILAWGWQEAFVKPTADAVLWRERSFELLIDDRWISGQFDRVVFTGSGVDRRAVIYDFKTNARRPGETQEAFDARLRATYAEQMRAYRHALARLTGIPLAAIATKLLAVTTQAVIPVI